MPANNVADFIAYAKANPGKLNFGSSGNGTSLHIAGELFNELAGVNMTHVPYRGGALALNDLLGGQIQVMFEPIVEVIQQVRAEKVKALGVTTVKRSPLLPDVPTIGESLPGYEITAWNGLLAPAATPPGIITRLNRATDDALHSKEVQEKLAEQGSEPAGGTAAEFGAFLDSELIKWKSWSRYRAQRCNDRDFGINVFDTRRSLKKPIQSCIGLTRRPVLSANCPR